LNTRCVEKPDVVHNTKNPRFNNRVIMLELRVETNINTKRGGIPLTKNLWLYKPNSELEIFYFSSESKLTENRVGYTKPYQTRQ